MGGEKEIRFNFSSNSTEGWPSSGFSWGNAGGGFSFGTDIFSMLMQKTLWDCKLNNFSNGMFNFQAPSWGDSFTFGGSASSSKSEAKTDEEKEAEAKEKQKISKEFSTIKNLLKPLTEEDCDILSSSEKDDIKKVINKSATKENYAKLKEVYDEYKNVIKTNLHKLPQFKNDLLRAGFEMESEGADAATTLLSTAINDGTAFSIDEKIKILDLVSSFQTNEKKNLAKSISDKYKASGTTDEQKTNLKNLADKLKNMLITEAGYVLDRPARLIDDKTKEAVRKAKENLAKTDLTKSDFQKSFDQLYAQLRMAEAQIIVNDNKDKYGFLESPEIFETGIIESVKKDLEKEKIDFKSVVINNSGETLTPAQQMKELEGKYVNKTGIKHKVGNKEYEVFQEKQKTGERDYQRCYVVKEDGIYELKNARIVNGKLQKVKSEVTIEAQKVEDYTSIQTDSTDKTEEIDKKKALLNGGAIEDASWQGKEINSLKPYDNDSTGGAFRIWGGDNKHNDEKLPSGMSFKDLYDGNYSIELFTAKKRGWFEGDRIDVIAKDKLNTLGESVVSALTSAGLDNSKLKTAASKVVNDWLTKANVNSSNDDVDDYAEIASGGCDTPEERKAGGSSYNTMAESNNKGLNIKRDGKGNNQAIGMIKFKEFVDAILAEYKKL